MARPIDAEKYMELLKEQYLHNKSMGNSQAARAWQGAIQLLYDMPTLTPPNEWVSVEERLPTKNGEYFAYTTDENINVIEFDEDCGDNGEFGFWKEYYQDGAYLDSEWVKADWITHWMPLPAPPDKEQTT